MSEKAVEGAWGAVRLIKHPGSGVGSVEVLKRCSCQGRGASDAERFDP